MKKYKVMKVEESLTLDGSLDKIFWEKANEVKLVDTVAGSVPLQSTTAKMLYDEHYLYVGFSCVDDEIHAELTEYNDLIYDEEVVEIFLNTTDNVNEYTELEVSPINTLLHYYIRYVAGEAKGFARVDKVVDTAVKRLEDGWSVEMRIPLKELTDQVVEAGTVWRGNLYRIDRRDNGEDEYSAWSETKAIAFHRPEHFGKIQFI